MHSIDVIIGRKHYERNRKKNEVIDECISDFEMGKGRGSRIQLCGEDQKQHCRICADA